VKPELLTGAHRLRPAVPGDCLSRHLSTVTGPDDRFSRNSVREPTITERGLDLYPGANEEQFAPYRCDQPGLTDVTPLQ
jgi:hypothetical protein